MDGFSKHNPYAKELIILLKDAEEKNKLLEIEIERFPERFPGILSLVRHGSIEERDRLYRKACEYEEDEQKVIGQSCVYL